MFLPYASDNPPSRPPAATLFLMGTLTLLAVWIEWLYRLGKADLFLGTYGIVPLHPRPLSFFTYLFLHDGLDRLFVNLCYLWVFGSGVEAAVGRSKFLLLFLAGGGVGGLLEWAAVSGFLPRASRTIPITGASAACAGMMGLFAVRYYRAHLSFAFPPIRPHVATVVTVFVTYEMVFAVAELALKAERGGVAHWAHVGGFLFGLVCAAGMKLSGTGQRAYLEQDAAKAMEKSDPGAAITRWEGVLNREPNKITALKEIARGWHLLGDTEPARGYTARAIKALLEKKERTEAAHFYLEMRSSLEDAAPEIREALFTSAERFQIGTGLEEIEAFAAAAEVLRGVTVHSPDAPEAEVALLKVITIYVHSLKRTEEARILTRLFLERYPQSQWRSMVEKMGQKNAAN